MGPPNLADLCRRVGWQSSQISFSQHPGGTLAWRACARHLVFHAMSRARLFLLLPAPAAAHFSAAIATAAAIAASLSEPPLPECVELRRTGVSSTPYAAAARDAAVERDATTWGWRQFGCAQKRGSATGGGGGWWGWGGLMYSCQGGGGLW